MSTVSTAEGQHPAVGQLQQQARIIRRQGWGALIALVVVSVGLLYLMFGESFTPLPFMLDVSHLDDRNFVLDGLTVPAIVARLIEKTLAVVVCIYLIQLTIVFVRYFWRLAGHLEMCAVIIMLAGDDAEKLSTIAPALLPSLIDFGRVPRSPLDNVAQGLVGVMREVATKLPPR